MAESLISGIITTDPDWRKIMEEKGITIKEEDGLAIFNYGMGCDFFDPVVQEARGIILDAQDGGVVCWPFRKFGNYQEAYADAIDWAGARVQEKIDGSIVKLWYRNGWHWSTNGVINAANAKSKCGRDFLSLIKGARNYGDIAWNLLDTEKTYLFELVHPDNQIVVRYKTPELYHIGTRDNRTGEECREWVGIRHPEEFPLSTLEDCVEAARKLNPPGTPVRKEGFVVVDKNWHRVKVKSPEYLAMHRIASGRPKKEDILKMLLDGSMDMREFCMAFPRYAATAKYYDYKLEEVLESSRKMAEYAKSLYSEFGGDRKAVAAGIGKLRFAAAGFWALDHPDLPVEEFYDIRKLCRIIPDYDEPDILK